MFKFWLYLSLCVSLVFYSLSVDSNPKLEQLGEGELCIYSTQDVHSRLIKRRVETGLGYIYYIESSDAAKVRAMFSYIDGESITLNGQKTAQAILAKLGYTKTSSSYDGIMDIVYGYSASCNTYILQDNKKINLQVATRDGRVTVGWPVILGSY